MIEKFIRAYEIWKNARSKRKEMCGMEEITLGKLIQKVNERSRFNKGELVYTNDGKKYYIKQDYKTKEIVFEPMISTMKCSRWIHLNSNILLELNENGLLNTSRHKKTL